MLKNILILIESLEPGNFHRGIFNGFMLNDVENNNINIIPILVPRTPKIDWSMYDKLVMYQVEKFKIDCVFIVYGESISENLLQFLKKKGIMLISWQVDDPYMLMYPLSGFKKVISHLKYYDLIYTTNMESINKQYKLVGISKNKLRFMPFGYDELYHRNLNIGKVYDVSFIGSPFNDRVDKYISKLHHNIETFGFDHKLWKHKHRISHWEMVKVVNQSKINLNFSDQPSFNKKCLKNRVMEVMGCGQFLLTEWFPEIELMFDVDKEIVCFNSLEELKQKMNFYVKHGVQRNEIINNASKRILQYSYKNLAKKILQEI